MALALSSDPRRRAVAALEGGMSCRAASGRGRPSVAVSSGDKRSYRLEAHPLAILSLINEAPDITLAEIVALPWSTWPIALSSCDGQRSYHHTQGSNI